MRGVGALFGMILLLVVGCGREFECEIRSDTSWEGTFDGEPHSGHGPATIALDGNVLPHCVTVRKTWQKGWLEIRLTSHTKIPFYPSPDNDRIETSEPRGELKDCID